MTITTETLIAALKGALAQSEPQPLHRGPKQPGLFSARTGAAGEAARQALQQGLLEVVRRETRGKAETEWVRITPLGVQFVHQHESPRAVLEELVEVLRSNQAGWPRWAAELQSQLHALSHRLDDTLQRQERHLEQLLRRAEAALERVRAANAGTPLQPWQLAGIDYLQQRQTATDSPCQLSELFGALRNRHAELALGVFHEGLAELRDRRAIELLPFAGHLSDLAEPEYALLEGPVVYSAARIYRLQATGFRLQKDNLKPVV